MEPVESETKIPGKQKRCGGNEMSNKIDRIKVLKSGLMAGVAEMHEQKILLDRAGGSLAAYLAAIRSVPMLSRAQEIEWAKMRETAESSRLGHVLSNRLALAQVLRLGERVFADEIAIEQVVDELNDLCTADLCTSEERIARARVDFLCGIASLGRGRRRWTRPGGCSEGQTMKRL
jgi:hypothetical protein